MTADRSEMNRATQIVLEVALREWEGLSFYEEAKPLDARDMEVYFDCLLEDHPDDYDEEWFPLVATPAIQKTIDWAAIAKAVNKFTLRE
jgi:hypothetical protein